MKRIISLLLMLSMFFPIKVFAADEVSTSAYVNNEVFVMYDDGSFEVVAYEDEASLSIGLDKLCEDETVSFVQPNYSYKQSLALTTDEYIGKQWALLNDGSFYMEEQKNEHPVFDTPFGDARMPGQWREPDRFGRPGGRMRGYATANTQGSVSAVSGIDINVKDAWAKYNDSGKEIIVAIVDTGVDNSHPELQGMLWTNSDEIAGNGIDDDGNGYIDDVHGWNFYNNSNKTFVGSEDDHGTHGAGTIAAISDNGTGVSGIANSENIKVMSVKALGGNDGSGTTASIIRAIQYAEKNGADICNLSLGTTNHDVALYQAIANSNMLFVVAAGNDGRNTDSTPSYPASYDLPNIISVANLNYDGNLHYSSNYGKTSVDIAAPGSYILSTTTNGGYSYMTGTSMSAPMVSAAAALVYSHFGEGITLSGVKEILLASATKLDSLEGEVASGGMLNLGAALGYDINTLSENPWETKTPTEYKGKAPEISVSLITSGNNSYLHISLYDEDNDAVRLVYAEGDYTAEYFKNGNGTELPIGENKAATLAPKVGIFTFFAEDAEGNTNIRKISVEGSGSYGRDRRNPRNRGDMGKMPAMPQFPTREMLVPELADELFREIVNEFFGEFAPWFQMR